MNHLPTEVIELIVNSIDAYGDLVQWCRINRRMYTVTNPKLWQAPSKKAAYATTSFLLPRLSTSPLVGHHIRTLVFTKDYMVDICKVLAYCPRVRSLSLDSQITTDGEMDKMFERCPRLETVKLRSLNHVTDRSIASLARHCRDYLREVELGANPRLTIQSLIALKTHCPLIKRLDFIDYYGLKNDATRYGIYPGGASLMDEANLLDPFPNLHEFNVVPALYPSLTFMTATMEFIKSHSSLRKLGIGCLPLDPDLLDIVAGLPELNHWTISATPLVDFSHYTFPRLEYLVLEDTEIVEGCAIPGLRHLVIKTRRDMDWLDVEKVILNCPRLESVDLVECDQLILPPGLRMRRKLLYRRDIDRVRNMLRKKS